jgi:Ser/Thr protein kinase RdoA (MazF antagonist)
MILDAVERFGVRCDGRFLALNSYENRVYQVGLEGADPVVVKFYRPGRWDRETILEEHAFARELAGHEIPVVAPLLDAEGRTLLEHEGFLYALFPRRGGHWPELDDGDVRLRIGRLLGRIHAVGRARPFLHRPAISVQHYGREPSIFLLEGGFIPDHIRTAYTSLLHDLLLQCESAFLRADGFRESRLHGDCHAGNILWADRGAHIVDLDDCRTGPAVQDIWMLLSGNRSDMTVQLEGILEGYTEFCDFDARELHLLEALRTLRIINYAGWLAKRWSDPAFPAAFPWFNTQRYWDDHVLGLREQAALMNEPPLSWGQSVFGTA